MPTELKTLTQSMAPYLAGYTDPKTGELLQRQTNVGAIIDLIPEESLINLEGKTYLKRGKQAIPYLESASGKEIINVPISAQQWSLAGSVIPEQFAIRPDISETQREQEYQMALEGKGVPRSYALPPTLRGVIRTNPNLKQMQIRYFYRPGAKQFQELFVSASPNVPEGMQEIDLAKAQEYARQGIPVGGEVSKEQLLAGAIPESKYYGEVPGLGKFVPEASYQEWTKTQTPEFQAANVNIGTPERPLWMPKGSPTDTVITPSAPISTSTTQTYTVKAGDSLSKIAAKYGMSWQQLYEANKGIIGTNPNLIYPGQRFTIPSAQISPARQPGVLGGVSEAGTTALTTLTAPTTDFSGYLQQNFGIDLTKYLTPTQAPQKSITDLVKEVMTAMNLPDYSQAIKNLADEEQKMRDEMAEEVAEVNENPWLSEATRSKNITKIQDKYETKLANLTRKQQLYQSAVDDARSQAQFVASQATSLYTKEQDWLQDQFQWIMERAEKQAELTRKETEPQYREVQGGLYEVKGGKWIIPPQVKAKVEIPRGTTGATYESRLNQEISNLYAGRYGREGAREKVIDILQWEFPDRDVSKDIYARAPVEWEKQMKGKQPTLEEIETQTKSIFQQYKDVGYTRKQIENQWKSENNTTTIPPLISDILDKLYGENKWWEFWK